MSATEASNNRRADYGLDAPGLQITTRYVGVIAVVAGRMMNDYGVLNSVAWATRIGPAVMWTGAGLFLLSAAMYVSSKWGKLMLRDAILRSVEWRGDEQVLDVGCGHGLMLIGAAKRLTSGRAVGVDVWSQRDQKDNCAAATLENAKIEGVDGRVELRDSDARKLPFPENSFDVVLSSFAIHNISGSEERETAIRELARVVKPDGYLAIADIGHTRQYEKTLRALGWEQTQLSFPIFLFAAPTRVLRAVKPNNTHG
jgi:arsenite methyltransferase